MSETTSGPWGGATPRPLAAYKIDVRNHRRTWLAMVALGLLAAAPARAQDVAPQDASVGAAEPADLPGEPRDPGAREPAPVDPRQARLEAARRRAMAQRERAADASTARARRRKDLEERSRAEAEERRARAAAQRDRPPPPTGEGGADQLAVHLMALEERILDTQAQMLGTLADTMAALENDEKVNRRAAVRKAVGFNVRLRHLERQIPRLERALEKFGGDLPGAVRAELELRRELIHRNLRQISEEHKRVVEAYRDRKGDDDELEEELEMLEEETPPEDLELPDAPGDEPPPAPDTTEEAGELLEVGEVRTPRHLTELFERIPETETPHGSLRRYREYIR